MTQPKFHVPLLACVLATVLASTAGAAPSAQDAKKFIDQVNNELRDLSVRASVAEWIKNTYITDDTEENAAWANEAVMGYLSRTIKESTKFSGVKSDPDTTRMLMLLRLASSLPAPSDPKKRQELATLAAKLEGMYGKGKWCGADGKAKCRDLQELTEVMSKQRDYNVLLDAWSGWHTISREMRPLYAQLIGHTNEGAKEIGFSDTGALWRSGYEMSPEDFQKEMDRLWEQLKPLYEELHCYVRAKLSKHYGGEKVSPTGPIPAHLLGNMWAQEWANIYPLVEPYKGQANNNLDTALKQKGYDAIKMVKLGEGFFTALGFPPLPESFWKKSMFTQPRDRDVVCHASAWDVHANSDLRIKMCTKVNTEDLITIHHELGHVFYYQQYYKLPYLYQAGANDGFHEAIGDALTLSITPEYSQKVGLMGATKISDKGLINLQMADALEKIAFMPFGLLVDRWRWDVFSGKTPPDRYNQAWWELRRKYQGVDSPLSRSEQDFDPGAKYHVPANVPYTRYFIARVLQFQFHRALCQAAGHKGPLHTCSIYGNKEAGAKLKAMLALGASKPWPDALAELTGQRQMDATAVLDYFAPLRGWLQAQNKGQKCGW